MRCLSFSLRTFECCFLDFSGDFFTNSLPKTFHDLCTRRSNSDITWPLNMAEKSAYLSIQGTFFRSEGLKNGHYASESVRKRRERVTAHVWRVKTVSITKFRTETVEVTRNCAGVGAGQLLATSPIDLDLLSLFSFVPIIIINENRIIMSVMVVVVVLMDDNDDDDDIAYVHTISYSKQRRAGGRSTYTYRSIVMASYWVQ